MTKRHRPSEAPTKTQEASLGPAILPYPNQRLLWPLIFLLNLLSGLLWYFGYWLRWLAISAWTCRKIIFGKFLNGFFRLATLLSVAYLVFDRIYETDATISSLASDASDAFKLPFTMKNNSHLFKIQNISWRCGAVHVKTEWQNDVKIGGVLKGTKNILEPGQTLNIDCNVFGPTSHIANFPAADKVVQATIEIQMDYVVNIFGYEWHRYPKTLFTYYDGATYSRWIRGDFAH
jgi:hypothetical protein